MATLAPVFWLAEDEALDDPPPRRACTCQAGHPTCPACAAWERAQAAYWAPEEDDGMPQTPTERRGLVLALLTERPHTLPELCTRLGVQRGGLQPILTRLRHQGQINVHGRRWGAWWYLCGAAYALPVPAALPRRRRGALWLARETAALLALRQAWPQPLRSCALAQALGLSLRMTQHLAAWMVQRGHITSVAVPRPHGRGWALTEEDTP